MVCKLYRRICRRWGPRIEGRRVTLSAYAWWHERETGDKFWRIRIDGLAMFFRGEAGHCQASFQRCMRSNPRTGS